MTASSAGTATHCATRSPSARPSPPGCRCWTSAPAPGSGRAGSSRSPGRGRWPPSTHQSRSSPALRERFPEADVRQGVAEALPFEDDSFDAALALLVVNFMADPAAGVAEMRRVTRPGGTVAACVWDYGGEMELLGRFWTPSRSSTRWAPVTPTSAPACRTDGGRARRAAARRGPRDVEDGAIVVSAEYESFEDLWEPFTAGVGPAGAPMPSRSPRPAGGSEGALSRAARGSRRPLQPHRARVVRDRPGVAGALLVGGASTRSRLPEGGSPAPLRGRDARRAGHRVLAEASTK